MNLTWGGSDSLASSGMMNIMRREGGRLSFFFVNGGSTSQLLCAKPAAPTQIDEHEHDDPHVLVESHVVITTGTYPIDN